MAVEWPHQTVNDSEATLYPAYDGWPTGELTPLDLFPLGRPRSTPAPVAAASSSTLQRRAPGTDSVRSLKAKWASKACKKVNFKVIGSVYDEFRAYVDALPGWSLSLCAAYVLHRFLSDESLWQRWAMHVNSQFDNQQWISTTTARYVKVPVISHKELIRFRNLHGNRHVDMVILVCPDSLS